MVTRLASTLSEQECYGCSACLNVCTEGCIAMVPDEEGFLRPVVNNEECTDCGLCLSVCQVHHAMTHGPGQQKYYAAKNRDEVRIHSTSGGMFSAISDNVLA